MLKSSIKKIGFALIMQALILLCSLVTSLVVPKYMGTTQYGYWQIYYFYLNYINFITLGYNDGLVLKYGGKKREELPIERIRSANAIMCLLSIVVGVVGVIIVNLMSLSSDTKYIYTMLFFSMPFVCIFNIVLSFFLAINHQEVYNKVNFWSRFLATVGYCILLFSGIIGYKRMIAVDYGIRAGIGIFCVFIGIYFVKGKKNNWKIGLQEVRENCGNGIFITAGALLATFMPMAGRVVLENSATIEEYAVFSFALSVLALIVTFTNAAGVVFFPILKNLREDQLIEYYKKIERIYDYLIAIALGMYIPAVLIIKCYLVDYRSVLEYMYLIFALCIPLGKMQMLITPYMKAFRMEKQYFVANLLGAVAMLIGTGLAYVMSCSIYIVALVTLLIFILWNILLEQYLKCRLEIKEKKNVIFENILTLVFILSSAYGNLLFFGGVYVIIVITMIFLFINNNMKRYNSKIKKNNIIKEK